MFKTLLRRRTTILLSLAVALTVSAPGLAAAGAPASSSGVAKTGNVLMHDSFRGGVDAWAHPGGTRVTSSKSGHGDTHAMRLSLAKRSVVRAAARLPKTATPVKRVYRAKAVVRVPSEAAVVGLSVREILHGKVLSKSIKKVRVPSGTWKTLSAKYRKTRSTSHLAVQIFAPALRQRQAVLVDDVRLKLTPKASSGDTVDRECTISKRGIPPCGAFFGASVGLNADPSSLEKAKGGGPLGVHRTFYQASQVDKAVSTARSDIAAGRLPWISFKLPHGWDEMANGAGDAWARNIAGRLAELPGPVWVAFHHEPELDGPIAQWTRIQERLAPIVRRKAPNVAYTVILMGWHQFYTDTATYSLDKIMPNTKIDVVGFDLYNRFGTPGSNRKANTNLRAEYFDRISTWAENHDINWAIGEIGYTDQAFAADHDWLLKTYRDMVATGGIGMSYFDSAPSSATGDWLLDTQPRVSAFLEVLQESVRIP